MSNNLRKLELFHTPPPLCVLKDTTLTGYVINTNGLMPTTLYGDDSFDKGRLRNKINILRDTIMEYNVTSCTSQKPTTPQQYSPLPRMSGAATLRPPVLNHREQQPCQDSWLRRPLGTSMYHRYRCHGRKK